MEAQHILRRTVLWPLVLSCLLCGTTTQRSYGFPSPVPPGAAVPFSQGPTDTDLAKEEASLRAALSREPNNPATMARLGTVLAMENKSDQAASYLEKALKLNPNDLQTRRSLATIYWQSGKLEKARANLDIVLKAKPDDPLTMLLLGMVTCDLKDYARSAKLLSSVLPLVRQRPETILSLARDYYQLGDSAKAQSTLQMLSGHPSGPQGAFQGGRLAAEFGDYTTAEQLFAGIQASYPDAGAASYNLGLAQYSLKKYEECQMTLTASIDAGHGNPEMYALLGWTYQKLDKLDDMLTAFEKAINMDPSNLTYFLDLGDALLEKKNYGTGLEVAKEAERRFPNRSRAWSLKGSVQLRMYLLTDALASYTKAVELDANDPKAALGLALVLWNMDRNAEAQKAFEQGSRKFANDGFFQLKYALFLLNAPGERDAAQEAKIRALLEKSVQLDGSIAETHYQLGNLAMKANNYQEALKELQIASELDPEVSKTHFLLARVYRRMGKEEEATKESALHHTLKELEDKNSDPNAPRGALRP